jgi:hypothetical protein
VSEASTRRPQPPDINRRTLTPFGYAVCVVVPVLLAAAGFTYLHFHYDKEQLVRGDKLSILTSDWKPGDDAMTAQVTGQLLLGDDRCLRLESHDGSQVDLVWPDDYEAAVEQSTQGPRVSVYDPDRDVVARNSDTIQLGGGYADVGDHAGEPCAPRSGQVFLVQSKVQVVGAE